MKAKFHKIIIGRSEQISFPDFDAKNIPAKIDTGAYRSAIHADGIYLDKDDKLHFKLLANHPIFGAMASSEIVTNDYNKVKIANSFGNREWRFEVKLRVKVAGRVFKTPFSLANRSKNIYPILLGRICLNDRFLIDPSNADIDRKALKKEYNIEYVPDEENGRPYEKEND